MSIVCVSILYVIDRCITELSFISVVLTMLQGVLSRAQNSTIKNYFNFQVVYNPDDPRVVLDEGAIVLFWKRYERNKFEVVFLIGTSLLTR